MDVQTMLWTATALFTVAALGGMVLAAIRFQGRPAPPSWLAMAHGVLAAAGLTLLTYAVLAAGVSGIGTLGWLVLLLAATAGAVLRLRYHDHGVPLPPGLVVGHASVAVLGYALLLGAVLAG
jgi:hypothetical protein